MRIAFIVGLFPALSATFIQNQVTGLLDAGHDVQVFAGKNPGEKKVHPDFLKYRLSERIHYFSIPLNKVLRIVKAIFLFLKNFHKGPGKLVKSLNVMKYGKEALSLNLFYYVTPFLDKGNNFDIIHCHFGPNGNIGAFLKELGVRGKLLTTFYGYDLTSHILQEGTGVYKRLFAVGDLFLPICGYFKKKLTGYGCEIEKIRVHPVGIELEKYRFTSRTFQPGSTINILHVGRLCEKKGFEYGIKAIGMLSRHHKNIHYLIVGDGPLREKLFSLAADLQVLEYVEFVGPVDQEELVALYERAHIFLLPSVTARDGDQEGTPTVLLEAQAVGLPVISTLHSGIPEIVAEGQPGFLIPEKDIEALRERLEYLITHPGVWPEMGRKGRAFIEKHFDIKILNRQLLKYYQEC
ncbi:MAG: glycosyltransferase [Candidatus Aminicenantes bacterium]|nr:glycosyltransferase [Candidatus Aminicenantes bacterium]